MLKNVKLCIYFSFFFTMVFSTVAKAAMKVDMSFIDRLIVGTVTEEGTRSSPLISIIGILVLLALGGAFFYFWRHKVAHNTVNTADPDEEHDKTDNRNEEKQHIETGKSDALQSNIVHIGDADDDVSAILSIESETRKMPVYVPEVKDDAGSGNILKNASNEEVLATLRSQVYREIHGELTHWVLFELNRLSERLQTVSKHILDQHEGVIEDSPENLQNEIRDIVRDISSFRKEIAKNDIEGKV